MANTARLLSTISDTAAKYSDKATLNVAPVMQSISSEAAKSTYYFPSLVSKNVSSKSATMMVSNLETVYAYFMRACMSMQPAIKVDGDVRIEDYLSKFHKNVGIENNNRLFVTFKEDASDLEEFKYLVNEPLNEAIYSSTTTVNSAYDTNGNKVRETEIHKDTNDGVTSAKTTSIDDRGKVTSVISIEQKYAKNWNSGDINKKNGMAPLTMPVTCTFMSNEHEIEVAIPIGIKCTIHECDPSELNDRLINALIGHNLIKNFIRWTTGEVESLSDMLFSTKELRKNVEGRSEVDRWFDVVERRTRINKLTPAIFGKKAFLPNMSIIISKDDVDMIERKSKLNILKDPRFANKIIKDSYLLGLIVMDDSSETAWVMYDGKPNWEDMPYSAVKRETEKETNAITNLAKLLSLAK